MMRDDDVAQRIFFVLLYDLFGVVAMMNMFCLFVVEWKCSVSIWPIRGHNGEKSK